MNPYILNYIKALIELIKKHSHRGHMLSFLIVILLSCVIFFIKIPHTWNINWYIMYITTILLIFGFLLFRIEFENNIQLPNSVVDLKKILEGYRNKLKNFQSEMEYNNEKLRNLIKSKKKLENEATLLKLRINTLKAKQNISLTDKERFTLNKSQILLKEMVDKMDNMNDELKNFESINATIKENIAETKVNIQTKTKDQEHYENTRSKEYGYYDSTFRTQIKSYLKSLLLLFGFTSIVVFLGYLYIISDTTTQSNMTSIISIGFVLIGLFLLYKIRYDTNDNGNENTFMFAKLLTEPFVLLYNLGYITYCKLTSFINKLSNSDERLLLVQSIIKWFNVNKKVFIIIVACVVFLLYEFGYPYAQKKMTNVFSDQLVSTPIFLNTSKVIGNIDNLYGRNNRRNYTFSLQAWIYIDQNTPNENMASNTDTTILNYGGVPHVTYNSKTRTCTIFIKQGANMEKPIFKTRELQLQKWNYLVFNYTNATMDVFLNTKLVATENNIVPFMTKDEIISGSNEGISGGIKNVVYSKSPLTTFEMMSTYYYEKIFKGSYFLPINI